MPIAEPVRLNNAGTETRLTVRGRLKGHVYDFNLARLRSELGKPLVNLRVYYALNEIPE